jgi:hypothetical protein
MLNIGPFRTRNAVALAPMAGVTDLPFRRLCARFGTGLLVGEMVHSDPRLRDSRKSRQRAQHDLEIDPRSVQIVGNDPAMMADAARYNVARGAQIIDINMGCPAKKVCRKAAGSALLDQEMLVADILKAVVAAVDAPRALISVSDKTGVVEFARDLVEADVEILSTGGTARLLRDNGIAVMEVSDYTGFPEMMDGRVKTLHPKIHGGILGRRDTDQEVMEGHGIGRIDLVAVNLYPFEQAVADPDCTLENAIENIDIGGPTMIRAAAKNHRDVAVVVDPHDYGEIIQEMRRDGEVSQATCFRLAVKTFEHTARYDGAIANYLGAIDPR